MLAGFDYICEHHQFLSLTDLPTGLLRIGLLDEREAGLEVLRLLRRCSGLGERRRGSSFAREGGGDDEYRFATRRGGDRDEADDEESEPESESELEDGLGLS